MRIYLDNCCYNRPYDDKTEKRVHDEARAIFKLINRTKESSTDIVFGSDILEAEIENIKNIEKRESVMIMYEQTITQNIKLTEEIEILANSIMSKANIHQMDALHLASAIAGNVDVFVTVDDKLMKSSQRLNLNMKVINPLEFGE